MFTTPIASRYVALSNVSLYLSILLAAVIIAGVKNTAEAQPKVKYPISLTWAKQVPERVRADSLPDIKYVKVAGINVDRVMWKIEFEMPMNGEVKMQTMRPALPISIPDRIGVIHGNVERGWRNMLPVFFIRGEGTVRFALFEVQQKGPSEKPSFEAGKQLSDWLAHPKVSAR